MPKRTNEFQQVVRLIHKGLEAANASVTESVMLKEQKTLSEREVDILVERKENGRPQQIAIECRDWKREATLPWIDELIGKYIDLGVQRVIAVSKRGFSKSARLKAAAYGIECISMQRALSTDWPRQFIEPGLVIMPRIVMHLKKLEMILDPPSGEALKPSTILHDDNGHGEELRALWPKLFAPVIEKHINGYMGQHFFEVFQTMGDLKKSWSFVC